MHHTQRKRQSERVKGKEKEREIEMMEYTVCMKIAHAQCNGNGTKCHLVEKGRSSETVEQAKHFSQIHTHRQMGV